MPSVDTFIITTPAALNIPISSFTATDVSYYLITESSTTPSTTDPNWSATPPTTYMPAEAGNTTLYAWVKSSGDVISSSVSAQAERTHNYRRRNT